MLLGFPSNPIGYLIWSITCAFASLSGQVCVQ